MVENVQYEIVRKLKNIEIRRYPELVIAKVEGFDQGFNVLFRFISGENRQKTKISMTAPVVAERIEMTAPVLSGNGSIAFVMPQKYELETTPEPLDSHVKIEEISGRIVAALRFSGRWSASIFNEKSKQMLDELRDAGIRTKGPVFSMLYNPPYTPWFLRRNEVAVDVELD
jgi:hypothetical protein